MSYINLFCVGSSCIWQVYRRTHSFVGGEEECLCSFVLFWKHGRGRGTLTSVSIASICFLDTATHIDPRIIAFAKMARKSHSSITNDSESSQKRPLVITILYAACLSLE